MIAADSKCLICSGSDGQRLPVRLFITWVSSEWSGIINRILDEVRDCGHELVVVDATKLSYPRVSVNLARLLRKTQGQMIRPKLGSLRMAKGPQIPGDTESRWLSESVRSELRTKYRGKLPKALGLLEDIEARIVKRKAWRLFLECSRAQSDRREVWIYPNGRYSFQRAILEAALGRGFPTLCYERSRFSGKAYLRPYRVHDRERLQLDVKRFGGKVNRETVREVSRWVEQRADPKSGVNPFATRFAQQSEDVSHEVGRKAVFFSSSRDELEGLGSQWTHFDWSDQYEAFRSVGRELMRLGYICVLRLHPNLANKSARDVSEEIAEVLRLRDAGFEIIGPHASTNSYDLVKSADVVVVSRSTIGIESLSSGVPLVVTSNSFYDELPGLLLVSEESNVSRIEDYLRTFDSDLAASSGRRWLGVQWDLDPNLGHTFHVKPTKLQSFTNAMHPSVAYYYFSKLLVQAVDHPVRKKLLRQLSGY